MLIKEKVLKDMGKKGKIKKTVFEIIKTFVYKSN